MNRSLTIPAVCCLFAFAALLAALHGAVGRETAGEPGQVGGPGRPGDRGTTPSTRAYLASEAPDGTGSLQLSVDEAEQVLTTLAGEYLRRWRQWETSPRRMYSRASVGPIPSIFARIEMTADSTCQSDNFLVATIVVSTGAQSQPVPCVVDRITKQVRLFAEEQWLTEDEWLKKAPLPWLTKP